MAAAVGQPAGADSGSSAAPATPSWKRKARLALGAAVLVAIVLAVVVPTLSDKQSKTADKSGATVVVPAPDLASVVNALLVANTPVDLPADLAEKQAATAANGCKQATDLAALTTRAWPALTNVGGAGGTNPAICYPKNGAEVVAASTAESKCTVIMLTNGGGTPYDITQQMNITTTKIFIGNPIDMPKLNATGKVIHRLFEVRAGGRLEVRAVRMYRAPPETLPTNFKLFAGATARVLLGGSASFHGVIFLLQPQTFASFMRELDSPLTRYRLVGGHVLVLGGNVQLVGCQAFRWQPLGSPIVNVVQIGREFCVVAGNLLAVGFFDALGAAFISAVNVGNLFAVLGGTGVLIGGGNINAAVANNQLGAGKNIFVGGGVMITTGYQNVGAFLLLLRSGFATQAVGGGVLIHIGHIHTRVWGIASVFNAGQTHAVGGGIFQKLGGILATQNQNFIFAGAGGNTFVGVGEAYWLGAPQVRSLLTSSLNGVGGTYFCGSGYVNIIGCPSASVNIVRSQHLLGGEVFIGGGVVNYIQYKRFNTQLANAFFGQGTQIFNGGGGVSLVNSFSRNRRRFQYTTPNAAAIFVGGRRLGGASVNRNQWVTASKIVVYSNKTNANKLLLPWWGANKDKRTRRVQLSADATAGLQLDFCPTLVAVQSSLGGDEPPQKQQQLAAEDFAVSGVLGGGRSLLKGYHALVDFLRQQEQEQQQEGDEAGAVLDEGLMADAAADTTKVSVPEGAECFLCNVGPLPTADRVAAGSGGRCQTSDACQGASPLEAIQAAAREYAPRELPLDPTLRQVFGLDQHQDGHGQDRRRRRLPEAAATASPLDLPDANLVWAALSVYCPTSTSAAAAAGARCISDGLLKAAVAAYLHPMAGVSVAVAPQEVHAAVEEVAGGTKLVPDEVREQLMAPPSQDMGCLAGTRYNVYVATLDQANVPALRAALAAVEEDPADFLQILRDAKAVAKEEGGGDTPCGVALEPMTAVSFPPVDNMPAFQPRTLGMIGPSISVGAADSIVPVTEAVKGQEYTLFLQNFPPAGGAAAYEVRLMEGLDPVGIVVATVDGGEMGRDGVAEVAWAPPAGMAADPNARFYLKASLKSFPAFFTVSQPFHIRDQATPGRRW